MNIRCLLVLIECVRLAVVKLNASRKSKRELILKREQEIAVKDLLLGKNFLAVLPTGYGKSLIFTLFLLARENILNENKCRRPFSCNGFNRTTRIFRNTEA